MEISFTGSVIAIFMFLPNILYIIFPPKNIPNNLKDAGVIFTGLERIGQIGCLLILIISKNEYLNLSIDIWFILMVFCIIMYWGLWIRGIVKGCDFSLGFKPFMFIPIPMAVFPVLAFGFAALYGKSMYLAVATIFLAIGHLVNTWHTYKLIK